MTLLRLKAGTYGALSFDKASPPPALWEYNFVYGFNGSGKTSLADAIEHSADVESLSVLRFDRDYSHAALAQTNAVEGLWVVAPEAKSLIAERDELRSELSELESQAQVLVAQKRETESAYGVFLNPLATELRDLKRLANRDASNYSTKQLEDRLEGLSEKAQPSPTTDIEGCRATIEQDPLRPIETGPLDEAVSVLTAVLAVADTPDATSMEEAQHAAWIRASAERDTPAEGDPCPLCKHPLSSTAIESIRSTKADASYEVLIRSLRRVRAGLIQSWPEPKEFDHSLQKEAIDSLARCKDSETRLVDQLPLDSVVIQDLVRKADGQSDQPWINDVAELLSQLKRMLEVVAEHEAAVEDQVKTRLRAFDNYETVRLGDAAADFQALRAARSTRAEEAKANRAAISDKQNHLRQIELELRGLLDPQVLNEDLARYLGHQAIRFEAKSDGGTDAGYRIVRADGRDVERLSEGELTAIALLYFLRSLREASAQPDIVVIDDPVSSLDDSGVFTAHSFIKDALARAHGERGPIAFITTHNHGYFRLLVDWAELLNRKGRERASLFETVAYIDQSHRMTCTLRSISRSLVKAGSEYSILMSRLVEYANSSGEDSDPLELYIAPNIARRVLEGFLTFKFGGPRRAMIGELLVLAFNDPRLGEFGAERRERLHKLLNSTAHGSSLTDTYQTLASRTEVVMVIADVTDLIRLIDADHLKGFEQ